MKPADGLYGQRPAHRRRYVAWVARPDPDDGSGLGVLTVARVDGSDRHPVALQQVATSNIGIASGYVVFDAGPEPTNISGPTDRNAFAAPLHSGPVIALTHDGEAVNPTAFGAHVVWSEPAVNNTQALYCSSLPPYRPPTKIFEGVNYQVVIGNSVALFNVANSAEMQAVALTVGPPLTITKGEAVPLRGAAYGDMFAYGSYAAIYLLRLTTSPVVPAAGS